ncbi:MAG: serine/threonine-protein kinase [Sandaracinaceae bacterium]
MQEEAARRLGSLCLLLAVAFLVATAARHLVAATGLGLLDADAMLVWDVATGVWAAVSLGVFALSRRAPPSFVLGAGLFYEVLLCTDVATLEAAYFGLGTPPIRLSFIVLPILVFPLVVPSSKGQRFLTTVFDLALMPFAVLLGRWMVDLPPLPAGNYLLLLPTAVAGGIALGASRILHRLTMTVSQAQQLGSYELVERLGGGGMGEVWRAQHRFLVRPAAVKVVRPDALHEDAGRILARFEREAQATSVLRSPHTVQLYDFGRTEDGAFYYAMELLDGLNLEQLVEQFGPVPPERAVALMRQACASLAEAHHHNLIHRDVKPSNVFVARLGLEHDFVKVLDFGLVKEEQGAGDNSLSGDQQAAGTPAYLSPEQALGGPVDARTDVYGLGCVAYWLLTGRLLFDAPSRLAMAIAHVQEEPVPPSARSELPIPAALDELVLSCLAKEPPKRPPSAAALAERLAAIPCSSRWTEVEARRWWDLHVPSVHPPRPATLLPPTAALRAGSLRPERATSTTG